MLFVLDEPYKCIEFRKSINMNFVAKKICVLCSDKDPENQRLFQFIRYLFIYLYRIEIYETFRSRKTY